MFEDDNPLGPEELSEIIDALANLDALADEYCTSAADRAMLMVVRLDPVTRELVCGCYSSNIAMMN